MVANTSQDDFDNALRHILNNTYSQEHAAFDEREFNKNWHFDFFIMFGFIRRFIKMDYEKSGNDLTMSMVLSEIWLYNVGKRIAADFSLPGAEDLSVNEVRRRTFPKCNAYSISLALGMSPETVRRKVKKLIDRGWVERSPTGELMVTAEAEAAYTHETNLETMRDFVATARVLFGRMGLKLEP